jgi:ABC-2 type transport system ATP-binding protein
VLRFRLATALGAEDVAALTTTLGGGRVVPDGGPAAYRVADVVPTPALLARLTAWCAARHVLLEELRTSSGTLEERYLELTRGEPPDPMP